MKIKKSGNWKKKRQVKTIPEGKNIYMFYCGKCTEPDYFNSINSIIKINKENESRGITKYNFLEKTIPVDPKQMAKIVIKTINSSSIHLDEVFVVFDKDSFKDDNFDNAIKMIQDLNGKHDDTCFIPLWSNQCLELWFILHFEYLQAQLERTDYFSKMKTYLKLKKYKKNIKDIKDLIALNGGKISFAIENAHKLLDMHKEKTSFSDKFPATNVVEFFDEYIKYIH